jgi:zinc D-Ala-D-Ala carboxypeptidase
MKLSKNFSLGEVCKSEAASRGGWENHPNEDELVSVVALIHNCIQPIRDHMNRPIRVNSCFRNLQTNRAIGSGDGSSHRAQNGFAAMDFEIMGFDNKDLAREIVQFLPQWSDLILEFYDEKIKDPVRRADSGWIHLSFNRLGNNLKKVRRAIRKNKKIKGENHTVVEYIPWDLE